MRFKHTLLNFTLLLTTVFALFSCVKVDKSLGEQFLPDNQDLSAKVATFKLPVALKMEDSLQGISGDYATIGAIRTKEFGLATFGNCANICPPSTEFKFGKDPVIKHIYFLAEILDTDALEDSQTSIPQDFFVYRMNKRLDSTTIHSNSITPADYSNTPLNLSSATFFGKDSLKIYLKNEYGTELLSATKKELDSTELFINRFKGLYIGCNTPEGSLFGGRINHFSYTSTAIVIKYNFQPTWQSNLPRKDTTVYLSFGDGYCLNTSTYSSKHLATDQAIETLPIEGIAGLKPYVDMQAFKATLDAWATQNKYNPKNIVIAKATYSFPFEIPADFNMSNYPTFLFPTYRNLKGTGTLSRQYYAPLSDVNSMGNNMGIINRSLGEYSGSISSTIQKVFNKDASQIGTDYNFWMAPIRDVEDPYYGTISYISDIATYYVGYVNGPKAARHPTLTILYTVVPE